MTFKEFCDRIHHLRLDRSDGLIKPYKPILLAAVVVLIHKRKICSRNVFLDGGLKSAFFQLLEAIYPDWPKNANPRYPFRHLENDGIWKLIPIEGASEALRAARDTRAESWDVLKHVSCAQLDAEVFTKLEKNFEDRLRVLQILWETYFPPNAAQKLMRYAGPINADNASVQQGMITPFTEMSERALEEHLESHWEKTPFSKMGVKLANRTLHGWPCRQVFTPVNAIDLLGFREASREWWVFELKRGRTADAVVGQISRYLGWIQSETRSRNEKALGVIIAGHIDHRLRYSVEANPNIKLWQYDKSLELRQIV